MLPNEPLKGTIARLNALIKQLNAQSVTTSDEAKRKALLEALVDEEWDNANKHERKASLKSITKGEK
jgi:hypothetical protein